MILCLTLLTLQTPAARAAPVARVDWPVFLARHDLVWDRLPTRWGERRWRSFTTAQPSVIVLVLEARGGERGGDVDLDWAPAEARPPRKVARKEAFAPEDLHPPPTVTRSPTGLTSVQTFIGGGAHA